MRSTLALTLIAVAPFAVLFACGGSEPQPVTPTTPAASTSSPAPPLPSDQPTPVASNAAPTPAPSSAAAAGSASPLGSILTTDPAQLAAIAAAAANGSTPKAQAAASSKELEAGLTASAKKVAPGMAPDGALVAGPLKEGEHLAWTVTLKPGKCYAIVGWSPKGEIKDLDLHLLAPPLYATLSGEDETDDNAPVVGRTPNPMCPVFDVVMPYKVDLWAEKGAGRAAVQLFSKAKTN